MTKVSRKSPFVDVASIAGCAIAGGAFIGASTNAINGAVSPTYFRNIMHWHHVFDIWRASIAQGIFEGLLYGVLFALVFTPVVSLVSGGQCSFAFAIRYVLAVMAGIYVCWLWGGMIAVGLATLSPEFYRSTFVGVPEAFGDMLCYAWVGGSIWGELFGGVLGCILGSVTFATQWRRLQEQADA